MTAGQDPELQARITLARAGIALDPLRRYDVAMLEALAGVVDTWGQEADEPAKRAEASSVDEVIREGQEAAERGETVDRGSFAPYAGDDG